jgi:DNA repair exonuclease SbcCD nuclease subunit
MESLVAAGLDYWALGHSHDRLVACQTPLIQYPGSMQGLRVNEEGPRGCLLVTATPKDGGFAFSSAFQPLGPVEWRVLDVPAGEDARLDELENAARAALAEAVQATVAARGRDACLVIPCTALIVRLRITGRTRLDAELRRPATAADLLERLRSDNTGEPLVWIKDLEMDTRPLLDREVMAARDDLPGEILRFADRCRGSKDLLAGLSEAALGELYAQPRVRKILAAPDEAELRALLRKAEALCLDLLENE